MSEIFAEFVPSLLEFLAYFGVAAVLTVIFIAIYLKTTRHDEIKLIKDNSVAAAVAFSGSLIGFALPLTSKHALVKSARHCHVTEHFAQRIRIEFGVPRPMRLIVFAEHAHQAKSHIAHFARVAGLVGTCHAPRIGYIYMREVDRITRPEFRFGNMQRKFRAIITLRCTTLGPFGHRIVSQTQSYA